MKYRRKPIIVEAWQWFPGRKIGVVIEPSKRSVTKFMPFVNTPNGPVELTPGDWIVLEGDEVRVVHEDKFDALYEVALGHRS